MEDADESNEVRRLRSELRRAKEALADAQIHLALEQAFVAVACEQSGQTAEGFKKQHAGLRRTARSRKASGSK